MPNYISFCPLTKNKKLVDAEQIWIIHGLKHICIWSRKCENWEKNNWVKKNNRGREFLLILLFLLSTRKMEWDKT